MQGAANIFLKLLISQDYSSHVNNEYKRNPGGRTWDEVMRDARVIVYQLLLEHCVLIHVCVVNRYTYTLFTNFLF